MVFYYYNYIWPIITVVLIERIICAIIFRNFNKFIGNLSGILILILTQNNKVIDTLSLLINVTKETSNLNSHDFKYIITQ